MTEIEQFKNKLKAVFEMTDLGMLSYFLVMEFVYTNQGIILHQRKYINEVLNNSIWINAMELGCLLLEI